MVFFLFQHLCNFVISMHIFLHASHLCFRIFMTSNHIYQYVNSFFIMQEARIKYVVCFQSLILHVFSKIKVLQNQQVYLQKHIYDFR